MEPQRTTRETPGETPHETPAATPAETTGGAPDDPLGALMARLNNALEQGRAAEVQLYRVTATGRQPVARYPADQFDTFSVGFAHGKGRYFARLSVDGRYAAGATFAADGPAPAAPGATPTPAIAGVPASSPGIDLGTLLAMMVQQQQAAAQQNLQMIQALMQQNTTIISAMISKPQGQVGELVEAMSKLRTLGPEGGEKSDVGELAELLGAAAPLIAAGQQQRSAQRPVQRVHPGRAQLPAVPTRRQVAGPAPAVPPLHVAQPGQAPAGPSTTPPATTATPANAISAGDRNAEVTRIGHAIMRIVSSAYATQLAPAATASAVFGLLDSSDAGAELAMAAMQTPAEVWAAHVAKSDASLSTPEGSAWVREVIDQLREMIEAADADDEGDDESGATGGTDQPEPAGKGTDSTETP